MNKTDLQKSIHTICKGNNNADDFSRFLAFLIDKNEFIKKELIPLYKPSNQVQFKVDEPIIILDRWTWSTIAYQLFGCELILKRPDKTELFKSLLDEMLSGKIELYNSSLFKPVIEPKFIYVIGDYEREHNEVKDVFECKETEDAEFKFRVLEGYEYCLARSKANHIIIHNDTTLELTTAKVMNYIRRAGIEIYNDDDDDDN